ncbi:Cbt1p TDEL_0F00360 [Torulaspora delbrueckii]|uniref:Uncharacterized protein n=1 Tax=Torulaspora delbrueckii TaxID=4950 RepID=G8ZW53_TORDE|nr:hypothetical protein TDEL_0F00360 [Torulaspora delbrueckii]CCE92847.1 hypothetical protein TDEL_0F00360 [Torulaspora delbrueckii]
MSPKRSATAARKFILESLKAPAFVYRYRTDTKATVKNLECKLEPAVSANKYNALLNNYNTMILYEWFHPNESVIDKEYYWQKFANAIHMKTSSNKEVPMIFLADDINHKGLQSCLGTNILNNASDCRCSFQNYVKASPLDKLIKKITKNADKLKLHSLALRIDSHNDKAINNFVVSLQPVLEESMNMYQDIHYDKLLQIARNARSGNKVRDVLTSLADSGLSSPRLVRNGSWLIFTRAQHKEQTHDESTS